VIEDATGIIAQGYDAVYEAMPRGKTLRGLWREHVLGPDFPEGFEHISFVDGAELRRMAAALRLSPEGRLVDLACGAGGPGLWVARQAQAHLTGIDISAAGIAAANARASAVGMTDRAAFRVGEFADIGLDDASMDAAMSCDALQYAPDKRAAFREWARILRPGGRLVFVAFELDARTLAGVPVLGEDPVEDYTPLLDEAGFRIEVYEETARWRERLDAAYGAVIAAEATLASEMGAAATAALLSEMRLTLERKPYRRRVYVAAVR
jgi:SAM-dependent methyltransferase